MLLKLVILFLLLAYDAFPATIDKRWYGVKPLKDDKPEGQYGPWPVVSAADRHGDMQPVRYCFADARSQTNLELVVTRAVEIWAPSFRHSQLRIMPDTGVAKVCNDPKVEADALVVHDATKDNDPAWNDGPDCPTDSATTGYRYASRQRGRHRLDFCHLDPQDKMGTQALAVRAMAHELGHAIGLQHEHQRPDRDNFVRFNCKNVEGYKEAKQRVDIDEQALFEDDMSVRARMRVACDDDEVASAYFPAVLPFIRGSEHRISSEKAKFDEYVRSTPFDYESIMIYNSHANTPLTAKAIDPKTWTLSRKDGSAIWQGGSERAAEAKISEGDIARVAQLYPKADGSSDQAVGAGRWPQAQDRARM